MEDADTETLVRRLVGGEPAAADRIVDRARTSTDARLLAAAALLDPAPGLVARAAASAVTTRDRQLVAIVTAHLAGDGDRADTLTRDHLADHPDDLLVAWLATTPEPTMPTPERETP